VSENPLTVLLLPGATGDADAFSATLSSVRPELPDDATLAVVRDADASNHAVFVAAAGAAGVLPIDAETVASRPGIVGFARLGDRWRPGTLAARRRPLEAHPTAVLSIAGHHRFTPDGGDGLTVAAPLPPLEPQALLLRPRVEASAVLVRARALDAAAVALLHRPHGDAVVWSRLVAHYGHLPSGEIAADVRLDPERHGFRTAARLDAMLDEVAGDEGDEDPDGWSSIRRELLRRLFVEAEQHNEIDVTTWLGPIAASSPRGRGVVADLQWALRRQREALVAERVRWTAGTVRDDEVLHGTLDLERIRMATVVSKLHGEMRVRDSTIQRLEAELDARDSTIERLERERGV
jgi:hypothetical protein